MKWKGHKGTNETTPVRWSRRFVVSGSSTFFDRGTDCATIWRKCTRCASQSIKGAMDAPRTRVASGVAKTVVVEDGMPVAIAVDDMLGQVADWISQLAEILASRERRGGAALSAATDARPTCRFGCELLHWISMRLGRGSVWMRFTKLSGRTSGCQVTRWRREDMVYTVSNVVNKPNSR